MKTLSNNVLVKVSSVYDDDSEITYGSLTLKKATPMQLSFHEQGGAGMVDQMAKNADLHNPYEFTKTYGEVVSAPIDSDMKEGDTIYFKHLGVVHAPRVDKNIYAIDINICLAYKRDGVIYSIGNMCIAEKVYEDGDEVVMPDGRRIKGKLTNSGLLININNTRSEMRSCMVVAINPNNETETEVGDIVLFESIISEKLTLTIDGKEYLRFPDNRIMAKVG